MNSALYRGQLVHARDDAHARRTFRYPVFMAALDLDELPTLDRELRLFSRDRANLYSFRDRDYTTALAPSRAGVHGDLRTALADLLAANDLPPPHATRFVTNLRIAGYLFNPVSFALNYDASHALVSVVAEVNNTYGGSFRYVLGPRERIAANTYRHVRELFVSPFLHGRATYDFHFDASLDASSLSISMRVRDADDRAIFSARFAGRRAPLSDRVLALAALRYPLMTAQVISLIHWQAWKLRRAGVPYRRPDSNHRPFEP